MRISETTIAALFLVLGGQPAATDRIERDRGAGRGERVDERRLEVRGRAVAHVASADASQQRRLFGAAALTAGGARAVFVACDVSRKADVDAALAATLQAIATELSRDRPVKHDNGVVRALDDMGFALAFQVSVRRPLALPRPMLRPR